MLKDFLHFLFKGPEFAHGFQSRIDEINDLLERYIAEIELFNPVYKLVSYRTKDELIARHIIDSLAPLGIILKQIKTLTAKADEPGECGGAGGAGGGLICAADAGSGAGLPGIPLAIVLNKVRWTLVEVKERRADFLRNTSAVLSLENVRVEQCAIERFNNQFDFITFRALSNLTGAFTKKMLKPLKPGGFLAAYKYNQDPLIKEIEASGIGGGAALYAVPTYPPAPAEAPLSRRAAPVLVIISK